jgi:hypothetical protein
MLLMPPTAYRIRDESCRSADSLNLCNIPSWRASTKGPYHSQAAAAHSNTHEIKQSELASVDGTAGKRE